MKKYEAPTMTIVSLPSLLTLQSTSSINGGGNKGDYQEGTQASRGFTYDDWDDEEWDEE